VAARFSYLMEVEMPKGQETVGERMTIGKKNIGMERKKESLRV